jgi:predicted PurR-regulated permease PerM
MRAGTRDIIEKTLPIVALVATFLLGALTLAPFVPALLWSVFISVAVLPSHQQLAAGLRGRRGVATVLTFAALVVLVLVPMLLLLRSIIAVVPDLATAIAEGDALDRIGLDLPAQLPSTWRDVWDNLGNDLQALRNVVGGDLRLLLSSVMFEGRLMGHFILEFLLGLILAAIILHNHERLARLAARAAMKLGGDRGHELGAQSVLTIRYTVLGILGSAAVQTAVAAFAYWIVGAPHWPILAFVTFLLGLLQVGPVLIWAPLAAWLWIDDQTGLAIFLVLWGLFAVGLSDNLVKALVVSRGAHLPAILVFLGAIGGLLAWGIVGIFVGPVVLALCLQLTLWWLDAGKTGAGTGPDQPSTHP